MQAATDLTALASNLGVSTLRMRAAMEAIGRTAGHQQCSDTPVALARELGLPRTRVRAAMAWRYPRAA